ncbi:hypothetical protein DXG01_003736 [Tephrocybe rancida]|nr:hypothetical protein DXG01_003736 [Tephrocybe rancida]
MKLVPTECHQPSLSKNVQQKHTSIVPAHGKKRVVSSSESKDDEDSQDDHEHDHDDIEEPERRRSKRRKHKPSSSDNEQPSAHLKGKEGVPDMRAAHAETDVEGQEEQQQLKEEQGDDVEPELEDLNDRQVQGIPSILPIKKDST